MDPWLIYVASALMRSQPRTAVHGANLALRLWIMPPPDRAILQWVRGAIAHRLLDDAHAAIADFGVAAESVPPWLRAQLLSDLEIARSDASRTKRKRSSLPPSPDFEGPGDVGEKVGRMERPRLVGQRPRSWDAFLSQLPPRPWDQPM